MSSIISQFQKLGGVRGMWNQLIRMKDLRAGSLVGMDELGNKYYEDFSYVFGMCVCWRALRAPGLC